MEPGLGDWRRSAVRLRRRADAGAAFAPLLLAVLIGYGGMLALVLTPLVILIWWIVRPKSTLNQTPHEFYRDPDEALAAASKLDARATGMRRSGCIVTQQSAGPSTPTTLKNASRRLPISSRSPAFDGQCDCRESSPPIYHRIEDISARRTHWRAGQAHVLDNPEAGQSKTSCSARHRRPAFGR